MAKQTESRRMKCHWIEHTSHGDRHELIVYEGRTDKLNRRVVLELNQYSVEGIAEACIEMLESERKHYANEWRHLGSVKTRLAKLATKED